MLWPIIAGLFTGECILSWYFKAPAHLYLIVLGLILTAIQMVIDFLPLARRISRR